jgi:hypothetical protein
MAGRAAPQPAPAVLPTRRFRRRLCLVLGRCSPRAGCCAAATAAVRATGGGKLNATEAFRAGTRGVRGCLLVLAKRAIVHRRAATPEGMGCQQVASTRTQRQLTRSYAWCRSTSQVTWAGMGPRWPGNAGVNGAAFVRIAEVRAAECSQGQSAGHGCSGDAGTSRARRWRVAARAGTVGQFHPS